MGKKFTYLTIDTETTNDDKVADFAAVISDRKGRVLSQCAILVNGIFTDMQNHPLFCMGDDSTENIWARANLPERYEKYNRMVSEGTRMIASVSAINRWLDKAKAQYNPILTAYNLKFDVGKCANTGIDLTMFDKSFCLWYASYTKWGHSKSFLEFALENHCFNAPTKYGNMTVQTNAEIMARFVLGNSDLEDEPHTALEDIMFYELPILNKLVTTTKLETYLNPSPYNWRAMQAKNLFKVR